MPDLSLTPKSGQDLAKFLPAADGSGMSARLTPPQAVFVAQRLEDLREIAISEASCPSPR